MFLKHFTIQHLYQILIMATILFCHSIFAHEGSLMKNAADSNRVGKIWKEDTVKIKQSSIDRSEQNRYLPIFDSLKYSKPRVTFSGRMSL